MCRLHPSRVAAGRPGLCMNARKQPSSRDRLRGTVQEVVEISVMRAGHRGHLKCQCKLCPHQLRQPGKLW